MRFIAYLIIVSLFLAGPPSALAQSEKIFKTRYAEIHYAEDKDINDFIWHLGGHKLELMRDTVLAQNQVDRIIERVEAILDMWPKNFSIKIDLHRHKLEPNRVAYYDNKNGSIHISIDHATDGVLAHEIAHAVIHRYFSSPPPSKVQEILTQYVDRYLWSDY